MVRSTNNQSSELPLSTVEVALLSQGWACGGRPESGIHEETSTKCNEECINDSVGSPELVSDLCTLVWARVVAALVPVLIATHRWQPQLEPPRTAAAAFARPSCYGGPQLVSSSAAVSKPHRAPLSGVACS